MRGKKVGRISVCVSVMLLGLLAFAPPSSHAESFDLSDILNGNVSGTYEKIEVQNVANTAQLVFENITVTVDVTTDPPTVTTIEMESGTFTYSGLEASITEASYDASSQEFTATATVKFPEDLSVSAQFSISSSGVEILGGRIDLPDFEVGNVGVKNAYVEYFPEDDKLGGGAEMTVPGLGSDPDNPGSISGAIEIVNGKLSMFSITADGLKIPLGDTDTFLNAIGVEGDHLDDMDQFTLTGTMDIVGGPEIGDDYTLEVDTTGTITPAHGWIDISGEFKMYGMQTGDASFSYRPPYNVSVGADANFADVFIASFSLGLDSSGVSGSAEGKLQIPDSVPIAGGYTLADAKASLHNTDFSGSVSITITPEIPKACVPKTCTKVPYAYPCPSWRHPLHWCHGKHKVCTPEICTPAIPAVKVSVGFKFSGGSFSFSTKQARRNSWEVPFNEPVYCNESNSYIQFMTNWSSVDKVDPSANLRPFDVTPAGEPVTTLNVPGEVPAAIFRITYSNLDVTEIASTISLPDGSVLSIADGALPNGFEGLVGFSRFNPSAREAYYFFSEPAVGDYTVTIQNAETLGDYSVELLAQNQEPTVNIVSLQDTADAGVYQLDWNDEDPDDNATVSIYLDSDRQNEDGFLLATVDEDDAANSILLDTNSAKVQPGYYYVFVRVDDGVNASAVAYSTNRIWVDNGNHPEAVTQIAIAPADGAFEVQWDYENVENAKFFTIVYTTGESLSLHSQHVTVKNNVRSYTVQGVQNGVPLLVSVLAVDERGYVSAPVDILRVVPSAGFGHTPPTIISKPDVDATVGNLYFYAPKFFDADVLSDSHPNLNDAAVVNDEMQLYTWELLEGPAGMEIVPEIGLLSWVPTENQVGDHKVVIQLTELVYPETNEQGEAYPIVSNVAKQEFTLVTLPADNTNGVEFNPYDFMTAPQLFAYEGTVYQYDVALLAPEGAQVDYFITEGPDGMTVDANGSVVWNVPIDAPGALVTIEAIVDGEFHLEQHYYLHVVTKKNSIGSMSNVFDYPWQSLK